MPVKEPINNYDYDPSNLPFAPVSKVISITKQCLAAAPPGTGLGYNLSSLQQLWPTLVFAIFFITVGNYMKYRVIAPFVQRRGVKKRAITRCAIQIWLLFFYIVVSTTGYLIQAGEPWFSIPLEHANSLGFYLPHNYVPTNGFRLHLSLEIGFYLSELYSVVTEPRRSDFYEYVIHHNATILLMISCWVTNDTRIGAYSIFLHDLSDIPLCFGKIVGYFGGNVSGKLCLGTFVAGFVYFRLYCHPRLNYATIFLGPVARQYCTPAQVFDAAGLGLVMPMLHLFWFTLIIRMVIYIFVKGGTKDIRSDDEGDVLKEELQRQKLEKQKQQ